MEVHKEKIRYILQFFFDKGQKAAQAAKELNEVYGPNTVPDRTAQYWFNRFRSGNFDVKDAPRDGRPVATDVEKIQAVIAEDRHISVRCIAEELSVSYVSVSRHLRAMGYTKKLDMWVPHELSQKNLIDRISICESLLNRNKVDPFLKRLVTGDEKWVTYDNVKRKRSWSKAGEASQTVAKPGLTSRKVLLCVWWDYKGIIHYELLPSGKTINSDVYCQQLTRLKQAIDRKRPELANRKGVVFHHDNARPHTSLATRNRLRELGWEVLLHPPYSPDLAPSDFHLFLSMANALGTVKLDSREACEKWLSEFFESRGKDFYEKGIMKLPSNWQKVIEQNGAYFTKIG